MVTTFVRAWHSIVLSLEEKQWSLMSWAWLDSTDSWIQTCKSMAFLGIVAFKLLFTLALSRKELYFAGGGNNYWMWWHSRWESCYLIQVINLSSLLLPVYWEQEEPKLQIFFSPTKCLQSAMMTFASTGILWHCHISRNSAHKTELLLPIWNQVGRPPCQGKNCQRNAFSSHTSTQGFPSPENPIPKTPPPRTVSLGSVLFARKQRQGQDLKARATHISVSAWLSPGHLWDHAGVAPFWGKQVLAMRADDIPAGGTSWSQRWPWVFP